MRSPRGLLRRHRLRQPPRRDQDDQDARRGVWRGVELGQFDRGSALSMPTALVHRLSARAPDDVAPIEAAIGSGAIDPAGIVAILGKTEGNGCVNDFTRAFAVRALRDAIAVHTPTDRVALVMSGGSEGGLAPHWLVLERRDGVAGPTPALAIGTAHTPALPPEHLGRRAQAALVADGARAAMADAGIVDPADVHYVQIKCPLLTAERIA